MYVCVCFLSFKISFLDILKIFSFNGGCSEHRNFLRVLHWELDLNVFAVFLLFKLITGFFCRTIFTLLSLGPKSFLRSYIKDTKVCADSRFIQNYTIYGFLKFLPTRLSLVNFNYRFASLADTDPFYRHIEILLNKAYVVLGILRQVAEIPNIYCRLLPAW